MLTADVVSLHDHLFRKIHQRVSRKLPVNKTLTEWPFFFLAQDGDTAWVVPGVTYDITKQSFVHTKEASKPRKTKLGRVLRKLVDPEVKDNIVRKFVEELVAEYVGAELQFAKTPDDYVLMHTCRTGSCMQASLTNGKISWGSWIRPDSLIGRLAEANLHKTMFYYLNPYMQGVYISDKEGVAARAFLVTDKDGKVSRTPSRGRKYDMLDTLLTLRGYPRLKGSITYDATYTYSFEPVEFDGEKIYIPLAHCDEIASVKMAFDKAAGKVVVGHPQGYVFSKYDGNGWITIAKLPQV